VIIGAVIVAVIIVIAAIPLLTNPELRLDLFRQAGFVPSGEGELVASGESDADLIVIPTEHEIPTSDRPQLRFLAAFISWPEGDHLRLQPLNAGEDFTVPIDHFDLVSAAPDGSQMYMRGTDRAVLVDVPNARVLEQFPADEAPDVSWDWRTAVWAHPAFICDRISNSATWIGCFRRPQLASYLAGDWHLQLERYGNPNEKHDVMRGLGFRPIIGFTADDAWLYIANERGIRRFNVADVTGS
jgi:hypothetical protein